MNAVTQAFSAALVHFIWQGAIVGVLLCMALVALRNRSATDRYAASCAAPVLMAALPLITAAALYVNARPMGVRAFPTSASPRAVVARHPEKV